jgi:AraC family transcriptional regulator
MVAVGSLEPWTSVLRLDHVSTMTRHRYADRFSVVRVETTGALASAVSKSSAVPALLVSVFLRPVTPGGYRLWVDGVSVPTGTIRAFSANVLDLDAEPTMWGARGIDYVHFHARRSALDDVADDLGYGRVSAFRTVVGEQDLVLAQIAKNVIPCLGTSAAQPLALDQVELILGAHLVQRYGEPRLAPAAASKGLATRHRQRVTELLHAHLDGSVRLADLARACDLSVSHFARSFKASFGVTPHRWLTQLRVERAQELLALTTLPLADVAIRAGFGDQAAFTRTFHRLVGVPPGRWRRENARQASSMGNAKR